MATLEGTHAVKASWSAVSLLPTWSVTSLPFQARWSSSPEGPSLLIWGLAHIRQWNKDDVICLSWVGLCSLTVNCSPYTHTFLKSWSPAGDTVWGGGGLFRRWGLNRGEVSGESPWGLDPASASWLPRYEPQLQALHWWSHLGFPATRRGIHLEPKEIFPPSSSFLPRTWSEQ